MFYAAIWANRKVGEDTESVILSRILNCKNEASEALPKSRNADGSGVYDARNNVKFEEGFVIFRNYKGTLYTAVAQEGVWLRKDTGLTYSSLNQLNSSIASGSENVWNGNWKFKTAEGKELSINSLRN